MLRVCKCSKISDTSFLPKNTLTNSEDSDQTASRVFPVYYSDKNFVNSSLDNQHFV